MVTSDKKSTAEKDFGGSSDNSNIPPESVNERETGARKLKPLPDVERLAPMGTNDPADRPKRPFGLKRSVDRKSDRSD